MISITIFEFIARAIPEGLFFVLAVHAFAKTSIVRKGYLLSSVLYAILIFLIRLLPIQYGIHTLLNLIVLVSLAHSINKIDIIKTVKGSIFSFVLLSILEGVNILFITNVFKMNLNVVMNDVLLKTIYGYPTLILLGIIVVTYYKWLSKRNKLVYN